MRWKKGVLRLQPCVLIHPYLPRQQEPCRHLPQLLPIKPISVQWNFPCQKAQTTTVKWWWERIKWRRDPKSLGRTPWHPLRKWGGHKPVWGTFVCSNFYLSNSRQPQPRVMESVVLPFKWHLLNYWKNWCLRVSGLFSISELSGIQPLSNCLENTAESLNIMWQTAAFFPTYFHFCSSKFKWHKTWWRIFVKWIQASIFRSQQAWCSWSSMLGSPLLPVLQLQRGSMKSASQPELLSQLERTGLEAPSRLSHLVNTMFHSTFLRWPTFIGPAVDWLLLHISRNDCHVTCTQTQQLLPFQYTSVRI